MASFPYDGEYYYPDSIKWYKIVHKCSFGVVVRIRYANGDMAEEIVPWYDWENEKKILEDLLVKD